MIIYDEFIIKYNQVILGNCQVTPQDLLEVLYLLGVFFTPLPQALSVQPKD